tara:strand:+ start:3425 stop:3643 length:219 start_codon:yes stop_codon:yes gene_type:complete
MRHATSVISIVGSDPIPSILAPVVIYGSFYVFVCICMVWTDLAAAASAINRLLFVRLTAPSVAAQSSAHRNP